MKPLPTIQKKHTPSFEQLLDCVAELVAELQEEVTKLKDQTTNLRCGWADVEIKRAEIKPWPQMYDTIYRLNSRGDVIEQKWTGSNKQKSVRNFMGIFRTREAAEEMKDQIESL